MLHSIQLSQAYFDEAATEDPDLHHSALYKSILSAHGNACTGMKQFAEAERLLLHTIEWCMKLGMEQEWSLGNLTQNLASCYPWSGDLQKAELTARRAKPTKHKSQGCKIRHGKYNVAEGVLRPGPFVAQRSPGHLLRDYGA